MPLDTTADLYTRLTHVLKDVHFDIPVQRHLEYLRRAKVGVPIGALLFEDPRTSPNHQLDWIADIARRQDLNVPPSPASTKPPVLELRIVKGRIANQHGYVYGPVSSHGKRKRF